MRLALYQPDIPQNTGTMLRLAACFSTPVDIIGPTGFDMTDRALRRAGLDYLDHVDITRHLSFEQFFAVHQDKYAGRLILLTTHGAEKYHNFNFLPTDVLLLGRESAGVPADIHKIADARVRIPIRTEMRSLNIAVAAAIVLSEALRQTQSLPDQ